MTVQPRNNPRNQRSRPATTKVLLPPIGSDVLGRLPSSESSKFPRGATATTYAFGTASQSVKGHIQVGDLTTLSGTPESQSLKIRHMGKIPDAMTLNYFADTNALYNSLGANGSPGDTTDLSAPTSESAVLLTNALSNTSKRFSEVVSTSILPKSLVLGAHSLDLGSPLSLGDLVRDSQDLGLNSYFQVNGTAGQVFCNGAVDTNITSSALALSAIQAWFGLKNTSMSSGELYNSVSGDANAQTLLTSVSAQMTLMLTNLSSSAYAGSGNGTKANIQAALRSIGDASVATATAPSTAAGLAAVNLAIMWVNDSINGLDSFASSGTAADVVLAANYGVPVNTNIKLSKLGAAYASHDPVAALLAKVVSYPTITLDVPSYDETASMVVTIKKDTLWAGDTIIRRLEDGEYLSFGDDDVEGNMAEHLVKRGDLVYFAKDFVLDFAKHTIDVPLQLVSGLGGPVLSIPANTRLDVDIHLSAQLGLPDAFGVQGTTTIPEKIINSLTLATPGMSLMLAIGTGSGLVGVASGDEAVSGYVYGLDGTDRNITPFAHQVLLPTGTYLESGELVLGDLAVLPQAFDLTTDMAITEVALTSRTTPQSSYVRDVLTVGHPIIAPEFVVSGDARIFDVVATSELLQVLPSSYARVPQTIIPSSRWESPVFFEEAVISAGHKAQSWIDFLTDHLTQQDIEASRGSKIVAGSILASGTVTPANIKCTNDTTFEAETVVDSELSTGPLEIVVETGVGANPPVPLFSGTVIKASAGDRPTPLTRSESSLSHSRAAAVIEHSVLPVGMKITNGNRLPVSTKILPNEGVVLKPGFVMKNPVFGPGFHLSNVQFEEGYEFPANTLLNVGVVLPQGTEIPKGHRFPFPFAYPVGHRIPANTKLQPDMVFSSGSNLPAIALRPQDDGLRALIYNGTEVPFVLVTDSGKQYAVFRNDTVLLPSFIMPKGFVMLAKNGFDNTGVGSVTVSAVSGPSAFTSGVHNGSGWVTDSTLDEVVLDANDISFDGHQRATLDLTLTVGVPTTQPVTLKEQFRVPYDFAIPYPADTTSLLPLMLFAVDFKITKETPIDRDFYVGDDGKVLQPPMAILPVDTVLTSDMVIEAATTLIKKIRLPTNTGVEFLDGILSDPIAEIKLPNVVNVTNKTFRVGPLSPGLTIGSAANQSRSFIELQKGTLIDFVSGYYQLKSDVVLTQDWLIETTIVDYPTFSVVDMIIPAGGKLPAEVIVPAGNALPAGMSTSRDMTLAYDYVVVDDMFVIKANSLLMAGSRLERDSYFPNGTEATAFKYGPVVFWRQTATLFVFPGSLLPVMKYNYYDSYGSYDSDVNNSKELAHIMDALKLLGQQPEESKIESL